jgi:glutathione S-transferase
MTMKLYYAPGVCSLAPHIALLAGGFEFEMEKVDLGTKKTAGGKDYNKINEKSSVPLLELDNGEHLTEVAAILQYIADLKPAANLAPKNGTFERVRLQEWLNYISSEIHKGFGPVFKPMGEEAKAYAIKYLFWNFGYLSRQLQARPYLMGDQFTVADAYLFTVLNWHHGAHIELTRWPVLVEYQNRIGSMPSVAQAMRDEGMHYRAAA